MEILFGQLYDDNSVLKCAALQCHSFGCHMVYYLVVEVTGISQNISGKQALPYSAAQAWRDTHFDKSLNLKTQQECEENKHVRMVAKCAKHKIFISAFCSLYKSYLALADKAGSIPVAEQLTQLFHPHWAQLGVADRQHNMVSLGWFISFFNQTDSVIFSNSKLWALSAQCLTNHDCS